jgi:hypothetical protein
MNTIKVYSPAELKESFPEGFEKAHNRWMDGISDIPWADEIMDSLKGLFKATNGIRLTDWSIGAYSPESYVKFYFHQRFYLGGKFYDLEELTGKRAHNWIKANILDDAKIKRVTYSRKHGGRGWRYDITKKDGTPWSCEFTGVCYDHDFIESLLDDTRKGYTLHDAFRGLADTARILMERELDDLMSEESFLMQDHLQYTAEGRLV